MGSQMNNDRKTQFPIEAYTTLFDYLKHITTLCTGSILLMVAFLEKLFTTPEWKACVAVSLISFVLSVVCSLIGQVAVIEMIDDRKTVASWAHPLFWRMIIGVWISFVVGLVSLLVFALKNLY